MTCPSPAEINKAMVAVTLEPLGKGCTLEELLEKCIQSFDLEGKLWRNEDTVHMTLVMHSWVVPSAEFALKLLQLYKEASQNHTRITICHFARFWITKYPEMFRLDSKLEEAMSAFWEVMKEGHGKTHQRGLGTSPVLEQDAARRIQDSPSFNKKRKVSLLFDHLEPSELADHLSFLDFKCLSRISHLDYRSYTLQNSLRDIPRLERSVNLCNSISQWVQIMILNRPSPQQRAEVFNKFIQVIQKLRKLQNFNTLMAVIGGLCHSAISRLKETHGYLSQDVLKTLSEMTELLSSSSNYSTYRRMYNECEGFKIPILGVQLKDLVSLNEALPDYLDNGKINVSKLHSLYQHILELRQLQKADPPFKAHKDVILLLTSSLDLFHTEDEIYSLSYNREPRSPKPLPSVLYKPPTEIVQWTPGVPHHQDPETLSHNVEQIVESIFQSYDPEQRGVVSVEDFDKIVASLPFSCHILEKEREEPVSRQEMTSYFMKASHICSKLGVSFLRSLVEARLKKYPLCASCVSPCARGRDYNRRKTGRGGHYGGLVWQGTYVPAVTRGRARSVMGCTSRGRVRSVIGCYQSWQDAIGDRMYRSWQVRTVMGCTSRGRVLSVIGMYWSWQGVLGDRIYRSWQGVLGDRRYRSWQGVLGDRRYRSWQGVLGDRRYRSWQGVLGDRRYRSCSVMDPACPVFGCFFTYLNLLVLRFFPAASPGVSV
uniref:RAS guanyl releasing protein 4 n=1 Tax=Leptobrachium leishanense TaxID=445787 RepID=A0A8C5PLV0_9ANUR